MTEASLKPGLTKVKFGEVVRLCKDRSSDPEADGIERYVGLEHLEPEDLRIRSWGLVADGTTFTSRFKPGQVLFGKRRAYQRKVAVADFEGVCSGDIYVFESADPTYLLPELLPFVCQTDRFFEYAVGTSAGSLSPRTNWKNLADFQLLLPSVDQQKKIIKLLGFSEKAIEANRYLNVSTEKQYQALIDSLVNELIKGRSFSDALKDPLITIPLEKAGKVTDCKHRTPRLMEGGIPMVAPGNVKWGALDLTDCKTIDPAEMETLMDHVNVKIGDLILSRNQTYGIASYVTNNEPFAIGQDTVIIQDGKYSTDFLYLALKSSFVQSQIARYAIGTTFKRINLGNIKGIRIPILSQKNLEKAKEIKSSFENVIRAVDQRVQSSSNLHKKLVNQVFSGAKSDD